MKPRIRGHEQGQLHEVVELLARRPPPRRTQTQLLGAREQGTLLLLPTTLELVSGDVVRAATRTRMCSTVPPWRLLVRRGELELPIFERAMRCAASHIKAQLRLHLGRSASVLQAGAGTDRGLVIYEMKRCPPRAPVRSGAGYSGEDVSEGFTKWILAHPPAWQR